MYKDIVPTKINNKELLLIFAELKYLFINSEQNTQRQELSRKEKKDQPALIDTFWTKDRIKIPHFHSLLVKFGSSFPIRASPFLSRQYLKSFKSLKHFLENIFLKKKTRKETRLKLQKTPNLEFRSGHSQRFIRNPTFVLLHWVKGSSKIQDSEFSTQTKPPRTPDAKQKRKRSW